MTLVTQIQIPVLAETAAALSDARRMAAIGRLVDRMVRTGIDDPLTAVLEEAAREAKARGLTEADVEAELAAYNAERRS